MIEEEGEDSDPGGTPVLRATCLENLFGFEKIFLKFEGANLSGTHKDRAAYRHVKYAIEKNYDSISLGTCGNYGVSLAVYSKRYKLKPQILVPERYHSPKIAIMKRLGANVNEVPGTYEDSVEISREYAKDSNCYDANPGNETASMSFEAYSKISYEIFQQFGRAPDAISVPVGNGTTIAGIYQGFLDLRKGDLIDKIPRFIGASTTGGNPVIKAFKERRSIRDLDPSTLRESGANEPLIAHHAYDGKSALDAIKKTNGNAEYISDSRMIYYKRLIRKEMGINILPASAAPLEAIRKTIKFPDENLYVAVVTGRS